MGLGDGWQLKVLLGLPDNTSSVPGSHTGQLRATYNSSSRNPAPSLSSMDNCTARHLLTKTHTHDLFIKWIIKSIRNPPTDVRNRL